ncbi:hypothetical protein Fcan01_23075 [Folsomia candida]|uniref:Uncharacterized protein n=1 Tax=Folsomia candida TaxID=158441 RepID=A0A226DBE1_FOLCA|nr:hypothetical protein Fcan01_23075 [Folsomia candida]
MSVLLGAWTSFAFYTVTKWILFNKMDSSYVSLTAGILLVLHYALNTISVTMMLTNIWKTKEICLLYINSRLLTEKVGTKYVKSPPIFDPLGLFLHLIIPPVLFIPVVATLAPLAQNGIDPYYVLFRNFTYFPKCVTLPGGNGLHPSHPSPLDDIKKTFLPENIFQKTLRFQQHLKTYRQLQILSTISNQVIYFFLPVGMFVVFLCAVTLICWMIKLNSVIPMASMVLSASLVPVLLGTPHYTFPIMADLNTQSDKLVRSWRVEASSRKAMWTKEVNSYGPIRANMGPFNFMRRKTRTQFFAAIFYNTASLVITVKV